MATPPVAAELKTSLLLTVAYDGAAYCGFARQSNQPSIAQELDRAVRTVDPLAPSVVGASRTDAGVHARAQAVSFATQREISMRGWVLGINQELPRDISVLRAARMPLRYDARRHALWKRYRYLIHVSSVFDPFLARRAWRLPYKLDLEAMQREADALCGRHDFAAFRSSADTRGSTIRELTEVSVRRGETPLLPLGASHCLEVVVTGDRFLHNMVRIIVGTLVDVGRGHLRRGAAERALQSRSRNDLGMTAPAEGLCLEHIELDDFGEDGWPG